MSAGDRVVVMLCTAARGGMRAVVEGYRDDGLFERHRVRWIVTHDEGSALHRVSLALRAASRLLFLLLRGRVAMVHSHMAMRGSFWRKAALNRLARAFGVPVIAHLHGSEFKTFHASLPPILRRAVTREFESCARVLVLSNSWADFVRSIAPAARVMVMPNYVRVPTVAARPAAGLDVIGVFMGVVGARKGVYDLIPALSEALKRAPALCLRLGGNGELERARRMAAELGVAGRVECLGWVSGAAKLQALSSAHFYVLPSHNEGLPMSILEAMACGLPVVATRVGGIPELVRDGIDGLLVDAGDVPALAAALARMAEDAEWRLAAGVQARARVQDGYSDRAVLPRLDVLYAELGEPSTAASSVP